MLVLENSNLKIIVNSFGGTLEFAELKNQISDEYLANEIGYNLKIIALHMDAFYSNSDNLNIPVMEALRIVSLMQDGENRTANTRLLRAQQKYK